MKKDDKFLLIALIAGPLAFLSFYTIPEATIVINILIVIGGIFTLKCALIRTRNMLAWFKSDENSEKNRTSNYHS